MTSSQNYAIQEFVSKLSTGEIGIGTYSIATPDSEVTLPVAILSKAAENQTILYTFHGAIDQSAREIPYFHGAQFVKKYGNDVTIVAIADPGLRLSTTNRYTWYAGDYGFNTQSVLSELTREISQTIAPKKTIFLGGSSGAHPALLHSHAIKGSICVTVNPLAIISAYKIYIEKYLGTAWPDAEGRTPAYRDDIIDLYAAGYQNKIIVLQNCTDPHLGPQVLPLVVQLAKQEGSIFMSEYFRDFEGHAYPFEPLDDWLGAVIGVSNTDLKVIARLANRAGTRQAIAAQRQPSSKDAPKGVDPVKAELADRIALDILGGAQ